MTEAIKKQSWLPDLGDVLFVLMLYITLHILSGDFFFGDGSTGWHLVTGNYILDHHVIPRTDLFSYTFTGKPWVAYEWLTDLFMSWLVRIGGLNLLATTISCFLASLFLLLYERCRKEGAHFLFVILLLMVGMPVSAIHWLARPHLITFLGVFLFYTSLEDFYRGTISFKRLLLLPIFMIIWVNSHPGFLIGLAISCIYFFSALVTYIAKKDNAIYFNRLKGIFACLLLLIAATFINPYFVNLYVYINKYLHGSQILSVTSEFLSPTFHGDFQSNCLEILFALLVIGLAISKKRLTLPSLIMALAFAHLSLSALRNLPLFMIVISPIIASLFAETRFAPQDNLTMRNKVQKIFNWIDQLNLTFTATEKHCRMHLIPVLSVLILIPIAINGGSIFGKRIISANFPSTTKPTTTLTTIQDLKLNPREGLSLDNWGGYINYKIGIPVFIDDRSDFYGEQFCMSYGTLFHVLPGWEETLKRNHIKWILFPKDSNLAKTLQTKPEWKLVAKDEAASLFILNQ